MSTVTENDLRRLEDLINSKFEGVDRKFEKLSDEVNGKFEKLSDEVNSIKVDIATLKEGQNGINKRLDDTQTSINKRLDNLDFIALVCNRWCGVSSVSWFS